MTIPATWTLFGKDNVLHRLLVLASMIDRHNARSLKTEFNLTVVSWRVLVYVCTVGPASAADVGAAFEADRAEISRAVSKLLRMGLVEREPDPRHSRKMILRPTETGRAFHKKVRQSRRAYFAAVLQDLAVEDRTALDSYLGFMAQRVDDLRCPDQAAGQAENGEQSLDDRAADEIERLLLRTATS